MTESARKVLPEKFVFSSCVKSEVWHPQKNEMGYERWYFDALSDDGKEAILLTFTDNFVFSRRYNAMGRRALKNGNQDHSSCRSFPAIVFVYYKDGKVIYNAINEFNSGDFSSDISVPNCQIGENSFKFKSAPYGSGYSIIINAVLGKDRRIIANFEWLSIESDFHTKESSELKSDHWWNLVAPRSDVTGRVRIVARGGKNLDELNFRGTGYHDHNLDNRWMPNAIEFWQRGRAHFPDSTAIFFRYKELHAEKVTTKLLLAKGGKLIELDAQCDVQDQQRNIYGLKYPSHMQFISAKDPLLLVKHRKTIDSSFARIASICEITLSLNDGKTRKAIGITEYVSPNALKSRWLNWLTDRSIRRGK